MAKTKVSEYSATAANNTDIDNINIAEGCAPSNVNNALRAQMAHLKDWQAGNVAGNALAIASGGTGAESASAARTNLSAAVSGANSDITSLTGLTTPLSAAQGGTGIASYTTGDAIYASGATTLSAGTLPVGSGGTGASSITANSVILGNGTSAVQEVAPGTSGNVLTSDGTTWTSAAAATGITTTTGSAPYYGVRAFANFDGTLTGTITPRAEGNIASIVRNSTGVYTVTFTTAMPDTNYMILGTCGESASEIYLNAIFTAPGGATISPTKTTSSFNIETNFADGGSGFGYPVDYGQVSFTVIR